MQEGFIFGIQRFSVDDGPGIRTAVFLKGCNMHCSWCHNPESLAGGPEVLRTGRCVRCGRCASVCPAGVFRSGGRNRGAGICTGCGTCIDSCPQGALKLCGRYVHPRAVVEEAARDRRYYEASGGGLTVTGGEPTRQPDFLLNLAELAEEAGIPLAVETNGTGPWEIYAELLRFDPLFLVDYKATDEDVHRRHTGAERETVLDTIFRLSAAGAKSVIRCPVIPEINDNREHFSEIAGLSRLHPSVLGFELMPYHRMGVVKDRQLGRAGKEYREPSPEETRCWKEQVLEAGGKEWNYRDGTDITPRRSHHSPERSRS